MMSTIERGRMRFERTCSGIRMVCLAVLLVTAGIVSGCASREDSVPKGRVMVLGIDGGTWNVIEPMMAAGQLPHIKKLYDEGLHGILQSRPPILSPVVWTTIFTGFKSDTHGVTDWKTSQSTNRRVSAIWGIYSERKLKTDVFNVPGTWPPEPVEGVMLSGFPLSGTTYAGNTGEVLTSEQLDAGRTTAAYRDSLDEIRSRTARLETGQWTPWFPGKVPSRAGFVGAMRAMRLAPDKIYLTPLYRTDDGIVVSEPRDLRGKISERLREPYIPEGPGWSRWAEPDTADFLYAHLKQVFDIQSRAALEYAGTDWGLFLYVMTLVDRVSHPYWAYSHPDDYPDLDRDKAERYESAVADAYRASDEALGKIIERAQSSSNGAFSVVVVSDHGFASSRDKTKAIGAHDPDGIYLVWGPGIKPESGARAFIEDVTPTLLYMMGMPIGDDMDGKPIAEVTADLGRAVKTVDTYEHGDRRGNDRPVDDATWEQLRGLGYVDGAPPRREQQQLQQQQRQPGGRVQGRVAPDNKPGARAQDGAAPDNKPVRQAKPDKPANPAKRPDKAAGQSRPRVQPKGQQCRSPRGAGAARIAGDQTR